MQVLEEVGPFALHELIGSGGAAEVWKATDRRTARTVAVKLLAPKVAEDEASRSRFLREAKHAARVDDPHVVPIYDFGDVDGRLYLSMKLIEGPNLAQMVESAPLSPERAVDIIGQVASALTAAHKIGLVHRDVKPQNILLTRDHAGNDFAYLADFGITRSLSNDTTGLTKAGAIIGTPEYLAPEQYAGQTDTRTDLYALGCVLFVCLTRQLPFPQPDPVAQMQAKFSGRRSYVVDNKLNVVHSIDAATKAITGVAPVAPGASMVALSRDGTRAWVSSRDSSVMTTFLTAS